MATAKLTFRGLIAPVLTPFRDDFTVNFNIIKNYAKFLADSKIMGVLVNGTTGEGMSMSIDERKHVAEAWAQAVKETNQHLMVQIGGVPLPHVLELAKHAQSIGAHSLLCLPELYNKPRTSADLIRYLNIVSNAAPKTPLLFYHIPRNTQVNIHMGKFLNDAAGKIPSFQGIKFTSTSLDEGVEALKANNGDHAVFLGSNELMAGAFAMGFNSAIATTLNMFPQLGIKILECVQRSNIDKAREIQDRLTKVCLVLLKYGEWVPAMKVAMNFYTPINVGKAREPLVNIESSKIKLLENELKSIV